MRPKAVSAAPILAALLAVPLALSALPRPAQATELAAHRALYTLALDSARGNIVAAAGTMGFEVIDACDGWAVRQRLEMRLTNREGQDIDMVSDYATWEAKDGLSFNFRMKQTTDTAVTSETEGDATLSRAGGPGEAHYTVPKQAAVALPAGTMFPMKHTEAILAAAKEGKRFITLPLFDGTSDSGAQDSSVAILNWTQPEPTSFPELSKLPSTRVRIAFFDRDAGTQTPQYEVGMRYWENGIADELKMDFGEFVMRGTMTELKPVPKGC